MGPRDQGDLLTGPAEPFDGYRVDGVDAATAFRSLRGPAHLGRTGAEPPDSTTANGTPSVFRAFPYAAPVPYSGGRGGIAADRASGSEGGVIERDVAGGLNDYGKTTCGQRRRAPRRGSPAGRLSLGVPASCGHCGHLDEHSEHTPGHSVFDPVTQRLICVGVSMGPWD